MKQKSLDPWPVVALTFALGFGASAIGQTQPLVDPVAPLRTLCIGRYLVDVPAALDLLERYGIVNAVQITPLGPGDATDLDRIFAQRVVALREGQADFQGISLIYKDQRAVGEVRIVAYQTDTTALGTMFEDWTEEAYVSKGGTLFRLETVIEPATAAATQADLVQIATAVFPRAEGEVPHGEGTCVPGAFVAVPPMSEATGATVGLNTDDGALRLQFSFAHRAPHHLPLEVDTNLNQSGAEEIEIAGYSGQQLLQQDRYIHFAAIAGQPTAPGQWGHLVLVEYYDQRSAPLQGTIPADQMRAMWPGVLQSIRLRE